MAWFNRLFRKSKLERQLDSELCFQVEQQTAENIAAGMHPEEARGSDCRNSLIAHRKRLSRNLPPNEAGKWPLRL
jgi:hypothetical protein